MKTADKDLAKIQTFVLDPLAPLTYLTELDAQGNEISHFQAINAAKAAIELNDNANAKISHLHRMKVISQLNKSLFIDLLCTRIQKRVESCTVQTTHKLNATRV